MSGERSKLFRRVSEKSLAVAVAEPTPEWLNSIEQMLNAPGPQTAAIESVRGLLNQLLPLAKEALARRAQLDDGEQDPPMPPLDDGSGGRGDRSPRGRTCGSCDWFYPVSDGNLCTIDPPVIWKGENMWRFLRPEVEENDPACSRRKPRS